MILICFAFAFFAFIIASNIFNRFWKWLAAAGITFIVTTFLIKYELMTLLCIMVGLFITIEILLLIKRKR